jgi:glutathione synthase/RimK-type ligase-like ATP-grasp enzyme
LKIAIHHTSGSFSDFWIKYCEEKNIEYKLVCCYDSDIIAQLSGCKGLMWNWSHVDYKSVLFARQLIYSLDKKGIKTFPSSDTCWHFDDKIGQKYLFDAIGAPFVKSYIFYSKSDAIKWLHQTTLPKVFKLRCGAAAHNVRLVRTKELGRKLINKAFGSGFQAASSWNELKDRAWQLRKDKGKKAIIKFFKGVGRLFIQTDFQKFSHIQKGYIYFQDFIPYNNYDTRLVVIGNRCFGMRRYVRKNDFRASGSGLMDFDPELIDKNAIKIAFEVAKIINAQCLAFDFVIDNKEPKIIEMSYSFPAHETYKHYQGYYDNDLKWHQTQFNPSYFIIEDFINEIQNKYK